MNLPAVNSKSLNSRLVTKRPSKYSGTIRAVLLANTGISKTCVPYTAVVFDTRALTKAPPRAQWSYAEPSLCFGIMPLPACLFSPNLKDASPITPAPKPTTPLV